MQVQSIEQDSWQGAFAASRQQEAMRALEEGGLLLLPHLAFVIDEPQRRLLSADSVSPKTKNVSFDVRSGLMSGSSLQGQDRIELQAILERFAHQSLALVRALLPHYVPSLEQARTSFRPVEASNRVSSWRKDDRRLHVDAFPSSPNQGRRLLRVFSNINSAGKDRVWNIGEPFEALARRFLPFVPRSWPGLPQLLRALRITKSLRSEYDHIMLSIHDLMKADAGYQATAVSTQLRLAPGATWIVCTDSVSHAAVSGQFLMEQTFLLPVAGMLDPNRSPLRVLERLTGRTLA